MSESLLRTNEDFEAFYSRNYKLVYRVCFTYMKNSYDSEDCTEDTFVKVLNGSMVFLNEDHEKAWLTVTAMNTCKDRLKSWWRRTTVPLEHVAEPETEDAFKIDETLKIVMELPSKYKDVIYLYYYMDYKTEEIASMLHKPASTVRNLLRDGRQKLKGKLGGDMYEG